MNALRRTGWIGAAFALSWLAAPLNAQDDAPSLITEMIGRAQAGEDGPPTIEEAIEAARRTVFRLQTYGDDGVTLETIGGGFLVSPSGLGLTRASALPLQGVVLATIHGAQIPLPVRAVRVDAAADLALVQLEMPQGATAFPYLEPADEPAPVGGRVWAICPDGPRRCRVDRIGGRELLPRGLDGVAGRHWLALSGFTGTGECAPIINAHGSVVGLTTPLVDDAGAAYALAAAQITAMLPRGGADPIGRDALAGGDAMPSLIVDKRVPAAELRRAATWWRRLAAAVDPAIEAKTLVRQADRLLPLLAAADPDDPELPATFADLAAALDAVAQRDIEPLSDALDQQVAQRLANPRARAGQPIFAAGDVLNPAFFRLPQGAGLLIRADRNILLLADPRLADDPGAPDPSTPAGFEEAGSEAAPAPGSRVLVGGLLAGYLHLDDLSIAVVQHGFVRLIP